jgi:hypothetical protein
MAELSTLPTLRIGMLGMDLFGNRGRKLCRLGIDLFDGRTFGLFDFFLGPLANLFRVLLRLGADVGGDVGGAVNEFKKAMKDGQIEDNTDKSGSTIEGEVTKKTKQ